MAFNPQNAVEFDPEKAVEFDPNNAVEFDPGNAVEFSGEPEPFPARAINAVRGGIDFVTDVYDDAKRREEERVKREGYARANAAGKQALDLQLSGIGDVERSQLVEAKANRNKYLSGPVEAVSEIAKQGVGGLVIDAPAAVNKAGQAFSPDGGDAEEFFKRGVKYWEEEKAKYEPSEEGKGAITKAFMGGARAIPLSGTAMASMGAAALTGSVAAPFVAAAGVATLFGGSQFTDTYEKGLAAGLPKAEAKRAALLAGGIEGLGETLGDYVGGKFLVGLGRSFVGKIETQRALELATDPRWAAKFAGDFLGNMSVQASTEYGQGFGETAVENRYGISNESPIHVGEEGAKTAMAMSVLMAPGAVVGHKQQSEVRQLAGKLLADENAPLDARAGAAEFVRKQMVDTMGEQKAKQWHEGMIATIGLDKLNNPNVPPSAPPAPPGSLTSAANIAAANGITPPSVPDGSVPAEVPEDTTTLAGAAQVATGITPLAQPAERATTSTAEQVAPPVSMSILDGVSDGQATQTAAPQLDNGRAASTSNHAAGGDADGVLRHDVAGDTGRDGMPGADVAGNAADRSAPDAGVKPSHVGHPSEVVLPDNSALPAQWEVVDADHVTATLKEGKNQPRDRSRAAADAQIKGIANTPDYRRLADSPVMDVGAPTLSQDGAIVGGNGRFEGVSRAYDQGTAAEYRARLEADAIAKGLDPSKFADMKKPVLVRRITQPFDTRALAVASNSGTSLQYSALEQAKIDGERMNGIGDIEVGDTGDVTMTGANMANVRRALTGYNAAELGSMTDKDGMLSQEGIRRIKNALLYKAYGNSPVLSRLVESADPELKSVMGALVRSAGSVASVRADMQDGNKPANVDIADDLLSSVEQLAHIKSQGSSVEQHLAQQGMFGNQASAESAVILRYFNDNIRSQKRMAEFVKKYYDDLAKEDHLTGSMFDTAPATKQERLSHAISETERANPAAGQAGLVSTRQDAPGPANELGAQAGEQPANAQGDAVRGAGSQQDTGITGNGTKAAPITVENHDHVKLAEQNVNTNPSDAQKKSGNYAKGHAVWNGLDITIENPQGSTRSGKDAGGKAWEVTMPATYGYIKRTEGADGDHVDVYMGKHLDSQTVYVIDQNNLKTGKFDEHKNMLGFASQQEAESTYQSGFSDGKGAERMGAVTPMSLEKFKEWISTGDTTKPAAESKPATENAGPSKKADPRFAANGIVKAAAVPKSLKITLEKIIDGKTKRKQVNAHKAMLAASQRVERLESLKGCVG